MDRSLYRDHHRLEESHWWFLGRRKIIRTLLETLRLRAPSRVLDIGSGAGGMLETLLPYGSVSALEGDAESATHIRERYADRVTVLPQFFEQANILPGSFDVVSLFDVLEHIEDDEAALRKIFAILSPGGTLIITVPAFPFLWSGHDVLNRHFRRYVGKELRFKIEQAGFKIRRLSYFNFFLFLPIVIARLFFRASGRVESDFHVPNAGTNTLLMKIFSAEHAFVRRVNLPIGVSILAVAKKEV
ncbi:MAG: class I SAM-dependent methyltransferase [Patescibacteria group bacterium]